MDVDSNDLNFEEEFAGAAAGDAPAPRACHWRVRGLCTHRAKGSCARCTSRTSVTIPDSVTEIGGVS